MKQKQLLLGLALWSLMAPGLLAQISRVDLRVEGMT